MDIKTAKLGQTFSPEQLAEQCKVIYGGVAWPGKRPGFAVVFAMNHAFPPEKSEVCLLDEHESFSVRDLVRQCGVLDFKYAPKSWIGDWRYGPAERFIGEMNGNLTERGQKSFSPMEPFELLEMKPLYPYILDEIRRLLDPDRRQLFLPDDSLILSYLSGIEESEVTELELGAYPAIEALAFAVIEMLHDERNITVPNPNHNPWDDNVLTRGMKIDGRIKCRRRTDRWK